MPQTLAVAYCSACGTEVDVRKKFCRYCGAVLRPEGPAVAPTWALCPNCGADASPGKKFCKKCGGPLPQPELGRSKSAEAAAPIRLQSAEPQRDSIASEARTSTTLAPQPVAVADVEAPAPGGEGGLPSEKPLEIAAGHVLGEPIEPVEAATVRVSNKLKYWIGGAVIVLCVVSVVAGIVFWSPEARLFRAAERGDLVTPAGSAAYDYYKRIKAKGLASSARQKLKSQVFPKLLAAGDSVLQKRSEGTSMKRSEFRQLADLYEFAADIAPEDSKAMSRYQYTQGTLALLDGRLQVALQSIQQSINYDPNWAPAFNDMGKTYVRLNDYDQAELSYGRAIQLEPSWVFPQLNLGGVYLHRKQWQLAEQAYLRATELDKTLATPWYFLGQVYEAEARHGDAIAAYQRAVDLAASRPSSAFNTGILQERIAKLQRKAAVLQH